MKIPTLMKEVLERYHERKRLRDYRAMEIWAERRKKGRLYVIGTGAALFAGVMFASNLILRVLMDGSVDLEMTVFLLAVTTIGGLIFSSTIWYAQERKFRSRQIYDRAGSEIQ